MCVCVCVTNEVQGVFHSHTHTVVRPTETAGVSSHCSCYHEVRCILQLSNPFLSVLSVSKCYLHLISLSSEIHNLKFIN